MTSITFKILLCLIAGGQVVGLSLLFLGMVGGLDSPSVPAKVDVNYNAEGEVLDNQMKPPAQVVLMIVDALRMDVITPNNYPFLLGTLKHHKNTGVLLYNVTVDSPTVTLPRIKTLVTGRAPTYLDVLKNLQTSDNSLSSNRLLQDNVIKRLREHRKEINICFFGDETWLRLFPPNSDGSSMFFKKSEGVTSFFVKDFDEVDNNVTRHLDSVGDCQFLILHYLGFDHIGHVHGPTERPDLIQRKLREMDRVIQKLYMKSVKLKKKGKSVILITGDHGMANAGGHGGSTYEEITTPLIAVITEVPYSSQNPVQSSVNQVDLAPTLSALFGFNVPGESQGRIILDIIEPFQNNQQLAATYQKNCEHLIHLLGDSREAGTYKLWLSEISKLDIPLSIKKLIELENELATLLRSSSESPSAVSSLYLFGIMLLILLESLLIYLVFRSGSHNWKGPQFAVFLSSIPPLLLYFSSSLVEEEHYARYFLFSVLVCGIFYTADFSDYESVWRLLKVLCVHRILMIFNQTGDKWSNLPDFNDWLIEENLLWLSAIVGTVLIWRFLEQSNQQSGLCTLSIMYICCYKIACGIKCFEELFPVLSKYEVTLQRIAYCVILLTVASIGLRRCWKHSVFVTFLLLILNLQRLQNIVVLGLVLTELFEIVRFVCCQKSQELRNWIARTSYSTQVAFIWLAHSSFFYQGNSNGIATVDVSAGYIGLGSSSSNVLIATLIFLNTYGYPILIHLYIMAIGPGNVTSNPFANGDNSFKSVDEHQEKLISNPLPLIFLMSNGLEAIVYSISLIVFRNHLFIWSVFAPKLLYLISQSVMYFLLTTLYVLT